MLNVPYNFNENKKNKTNYLNVGFSNMQITFLTRRIVYLTEHLKKNQKDFHSKRGLVNLSNKRKRLLKYLKSKSLGDYELILKNLNIRGVK